MFVSARLAAAFAVVSSVAFGTAPAFAADLYDPPRAHAPYYDDPDDAEPYEDRADTRSDYERYSQPPADFQPPYRPRVATRVPKSFDESEIYRRTDVEPPYEAAEGYDECVPRRVARRRLIRNGWDDFRDLQVRGRIVLVRARSPSGRPFDLTIDRCSGDIVDARPLRSRIYDEFAYDRRPYRRWPY